MGRGRKGGGNSISPVWVIKNNLSQKQASSLVCRVTPGSQPPSITQAVARRVWSPPEGL